MIAAFWEPLTAISTLVLAFVTTFLALSTRRLARSANAEVRANWRPVLSIEARVSEGGITPGVGIEDKKLWVNVRNVGRGPALHVSGALEGERRPPHRSNEVVGPDGYTALSWADFEPPSLPEGSLPTWTHVKGSMTYLDVTQASYTTEFVVGFSPDGRIEIVDQHVRAQPALPPPGWALAYANARVDLERAWLRWCGRSGSRPA